MSHVRLRPRRRAVAAVLAAALVSAVPAAWPAAAANGDNCGAVTLEDRPRLRRSTAGDFDWGPYQHAHNRYQRNRPRIFASGYLSGKHYYVGFNQDVCRHLRRIRDMVDKRWRFRAFVAEYSWAQLMANRRCISRVSERNDWLRTNGSDTDVWRNKNIVWLRKRTERREAFMRRKCPGAAIKFFEGGAEPH